MLLVRSERVVKDVIRVLIKSHDEMLHPLRRRRFNLGRRYREKKRERSTTNTPEFSNINDSMLFDRVSSPSVTIEEMAESISLAPVPLI